jgi:hypothetical protein
MRTLGHLSGGYEEHRLLRRHTQMRPVMLDEGVASEAAAVGTLQDLQTVPV